MFRTYLHIIILIFSSLFCYYFIWTTCSTGLYQYKIPKEWIKRSLCRAWNKLYPSNNKNISNQLIPKKRNEAHTTFTMHTILSRGFQSIEPTIHLLMMKGEKKTHETTLLYYVYNKPSAFWILLSLTQLCMCACLCISLSTVHRNEGIQIITIEHNCTLEVSTLAMHFFPRKVVVAVAVISLQKIGIIPIFSPFL